MLMDLILKYIYVPGLEGISANSYVGLKQAVAATKRKGRIPSFECTVSVNRAHPIF